MLKYADFAFLLLFLILKVTPLNSSKIYSFCRCRTDLKQIFYIHMILHFLHLTKPATNFHQKYFERKKKMLSRINTIPSNYLSKSNRVMTI